MKNFYLHVVDTIPVHYDMYVLVGNIRNYYAVAVKLVLFFPAHSTKLKVICGLKITKDPIWTA